ncbi:MAG: right-handed parallel beta-helix repeat-containing protein, partial [candidate division KSB1 bacterium]|nr:right-handed parallel beta-helix repeat-containing protein [candidate division KSB1 bacterium]
MKGRRALIAILWVGFILQGKAAEFYVSPNGNDNWSGALPQPNSTQTDGPFATPQRAQAAARTAPRTEPITVYIREGIYFVGTWRFDPQDSGTPSAPVTFRNYADERPVISGGRAITGWRTQGTLWVTTIDEVKSGKLYFKELYVNGERRDRARSPRKGEFFRITGSVEGNDKRSFRFRPGDLSNFDNRADVNIVLYQAWLGIHLWIDALNTAQNTVAFSPQLIFPVGNFDSRTRYYVENAFELLDEPGEWYLNRKTGELFYYPLPGETPESCEVVAPLVDRVLELRGSSSAKVRHLRFEGLTFLHADWIVADKNQTELQAHILLDDAIVYARFAEDCSFRKCEIALGGAHGVILSQGCTGNRIEQCHIHSLGGGGIYIGNTTGWNACEKPPAALAIAENTVDNCFLHDLTHGHHGSVGIWIGNSSNNTVTHNEICDLDYTGISVGWCWGYSPSSSGGNEIAYNHIHHLGQGELSDMGGIYTLGISPGTHLHHNLIHDVYAYSYGGWGIYTDEGSSDILIENNIVYRTKSPSFHQHYGQRNLVRNNIFALSATAGLQRTRDEAGKSFTFERNIVLTTNGEVLSGSWGDKNFAVDRNLYWDLYTGARLDFGFKPLKAWQAMGFDKNSLVADPLFADPHNGDFALSPSSPVYAISFESIETSAIGLYGDPEWTNLPKTIRNRSVNPIAQPPIAPFFAKDDWFETFDELPVDGVPPHAQIWGVAGYAGQNIFVTNEKSLSGPNSLKFDDRVL